MPYTTKKTLLESIRNGNDVSWNEFYETYRPLIVFCANKQGLQPPEIDDLIQIVMLKVFKSQKSFHYDRQAGRFRDYLGAIIRNAISDIFRARKHTQVCSVHEGSFLEDSFSEEWNEEWKRHILTQAINLLRSRVEEQTFQAFELFALNGRPPREVAEFLNISIHKVYDAKARCLAQLRENIDFLTGSL